MDASARRHIAGVQRADVPVVAILRRSTADSAGWIAGVLGAWVAVVTRLNGSLAGDVSRPCGTFHARIGRGARVLIVAGRPGGQRGAETLSLGSAGLRLRAGVAVVAGCSGRKQRASTYSRASGAAVSGGAWVCIVASRSHRPGDELATDERIARVGGAGIRIVTDDRIMAAESRGAVARVDRTNAMVVA